MLKYGKKLGQALFWASVAETTKCPLVNVSIFISWAMINSSVPKPSGNRGYNICAVLPESDTRICSIWPWGYWTRKSVPKGRAKGHGGQRSGRRSEDRYTHPRKQDQLTWQRRMSVQYLDFIYLFIYSFIHLFIRPMACGSSQARNGTWATAVTMPNP